jgi:hypothetical protein
MNTRVHCEALLTPSGISFYYRDVRLMDPVPVEERAWFVSYPTFDCLPYHQPFVLPFVVQFLVTELENA